MVKIHLLKQDLLARKLIVFLFKNHVVGTHLKRPDVSLRNKNTIYLIIWVVFLGRTIKTLSLDK